MMMKRRRRKGALVATRMVMYSLLYKNKMCKCICICNDSLVPFFRCTVYKDDIFISMIPHLPYMSTFIYASFMGFSGSSMTC